MTIAGKEIGITKQPFSLLKKNVCDDAKDLEDMIKRVKEYQMQLDNKMKEIENQPIFNEKDNLQEKDWLNSVADLEEQEAIENKKNIKSRSLFTKETVERIGQMNSSKDVERGA